MFSFNLLKCNLFQETNNYILQVPVFTLAGILVFFLELITLERFHGFFEPTGFYQDSKIRDIGVIQIQYSNLSENSQLHLQDLQKANNSKVPLWEKPFLFNVSSFRWLRNNETLCKRDTAHPNARIFPILVHTARSHFSQRLIIRQSWGSLLFYKKWSIRLIFLIGEADRGLQPLNEEEKFTEQERLLDNEQAMFGDLVQGNFIDSYRNLTYKIMMGFKWVLTYCNNSKFVLKVDDDMFIDIMRFLNWRGEDLQALTDENHPKYSVPELYCSTFVGTKPQRCIGCKWYTSETEWPSDYYPDYCSGGCYGLTVDLIRKLYSVADTTPFFWVDDIYATGILLEEVKKRNPGYEPQYRHLWGERRHLDFRNFRPMCERHDITMERKFGAVVPVSSGSNFERDMMCLWNKTVYDDEAY